MPSSPAGEALHAQIFALSGFPGAWQVIRLLKLQLDRLQRLSLAEKAQVAEACLAT